MPLERLGSDWGGFWVDLDLVPRGSVAICAGIGNDITFDEALIDRCGCFIVGLDPTIRATQHIAREVQGGRISADNYWHCTRALFGYPNQELWCQSFRSVFRGGGEKSVSITLPELWAQYPACALVKLDVEGSEYTILDKLESVPENVKQFCIEFHHRLPEVPFERFDTERVVDKLLGFGFSMVKCEKDYEDTLFTRR